MGFTLFREGYVEYLDLAKGKGLVSFHKKVWSLGKRQLAVCKEESVPNALDTLGISLII